MTTYSTVKDELAIYYRKRAFQRVILAIMIVIGVFFGIRILFKKQPVASQTQTIIYVPTQDTQQNTVDNTIQQPVAEVKPDYEVDDSMVCWGSSYSSVFVQGGDTICTGIDNKKYDYALVPNRQEVVLDVSGINGYLKGTFVLSKFNMSTSYFREIEIEIYDVGKNDPFFVTTMDADTRSDINLSVKLTGHDKIIVTFGYAGGDVYLTTNGLFISETR